MRDLVFDLRPQCPIANEQEFRGRTFLKNEGDGCGEIILRFLNIEFRDMTDDDIVGVKAQ